MGNDGGSIPTREEQIKVKKKPPKRDAKETYRIRWTSCSISKEPLQPPIVCCALGNLFSKEKLIDCLLNKSLPKEFDYIKSLKRDVVELKFNEEEGRWTCPIAHVTFGEEGSGGFTANKKCGHVVSSKAMKEIESTSCLVCGTACEKSDYIILNPSEEEQKQMREEIKKKSSSKRKRDKPESSGKEEAGEKGKKTKQPQISGSTGSGVAAITAIIAAEAEKAAQQKATSDGVFASLFIKKEKEETKTAESLLMQGSSRAFF